MENRITRLFGIKYPIVQAGMVWCSGWRLASEVSNAGGLGLIGAGSMSPDILREHIQKCKKATTAPFGVNLPLIYSQISDHIQVVIEEGVKIVFTSAGNPSIWTKMLKEHGIIVCHVVSSSKFAMKAQDAGVDAIVAEGFEAGGHNGKEETTTMCLIPLVKDYISVPLIAAGGVGDGRGMAAAFALGAEGVQIGSRYAATVESSAHIDFKNRILESKEGDNELVMKSLTPVRLLKNPFYEKIKKAEQEGKPTEEIKNILGKGRSKLGIFEGDLVDGELEIGQVAALIQDLPHAGDLTRKIWQEFVQTHEEFCQLKLD